STSGTATFTNLSISGAAGAFTLRFSSGSLAPATSGTITISLPVTPTALSITTQPSSSATSGLALAVQPSIQLRDASNNAAAKSGVAVTATIASGTGGTLAGATTVSTNASGVATFSNLTISGLGAYTLNFASTGLTSVTSSAINVVAAPPAAIE